MYHASKYSALLHTPDPWMGSKGQNIFSKGQFAYQITRKKEQNIMQVKCLTLCTPWPFGSGKKARHRHFVQISIYFD